MKKQQEKTVSTTESGLLKEQIEPKSISFAEASVSKRYDDVHQVLIPDEVAMVRWTNNAYEFVCKNNITLRIQFLSAGIIRLRYQTGGSFEADFSYAIAPDFQPEKVTVTLQESDHEYLLVSDLLQVVVSKSGLRVKFYDSDDRVISEDEGGYTATRTVMKGWCEQRIEKKRLKKELFLGLGDKSCGMNLSGKKFENWCTDSYGYGTQSDPLYRAIPFYYSVHQGISYGIFLDNSFKTHFDFDSEGQEITSFWAEGGEMNYYFIYGPQLTDVARAFAKLTGTHELPPIWALGYHQCRWSYYPETTVRALADRFREAEIPCDAIYFDIDYMDGYRCFTWNETHFPNPKKLIADLKEQGFHSVAMIDPGIKEDPDYFIYQQGMEGGMFAKTTDGDVAKAPVWPGFCVFPDFTNPKVRDWWGDQYTDLYKNLGMSGFWNDMNEPAVFHVNHKTLPDHVMHDYDGHPCGHRKAHNVYGQQMNRASWVGFKRLKSEKRPFLLSRATYAGGQRYTALWTGDNLATWEHLQIANIQCQRLSISGFSFCGTDIGGFAGKPDGELFVRWLQLSVFHPLMRTHSMGQHSSGDAVPTEDAKPAEPIFDQEPFSFGDKWTPIAKKAIELRYCLLPSLYTAMWLHRLDGTPVLRHLLFEDANDSKLWDQDRDFLFAEHILVSPVVVSKQQRQNVYLPKGNWYYFWTGQLSAGELFVNTMPDQIPFFVREGAVLPIYPIRQYTGEKPIDELTLYVYYKQGTETSHLYEDEGEGYDYETNEAFSLKIFETEGKNDSFVVRQRKEGQFKTTYESVKVYLVGFPAFVQKCIVDGVELPIKEIRLRDRSLYTLQTSPDFITIEWHS